MGFDAANLEEHGLDLGRKDVDASNYDHIIGSPNDAVHSCCRAPAGAGLAEQTGAIASAITEQRQGLFCNAGQDKLTHLAIGDRFASLRINDFSYEMVFKDMQSQLPCTFNGDSRSDHF